MTESAAAAKVHWPLQEAKQGRAFHQRVYNLDFHPASIICCCSGTLAAAGLKDGDLLELMQNAPAQQLAGINTGNPFAQGPDGTAVNAEAFLRALRANSQMMATLPEPARRIVEVGCCTDLVDLVINQSCASHVAEMSTVMTGQAQNPAAHCESEQPVRAGNIWARNGKLQQVVLAGMPSAEKETCGHMGSAQKTLCCAVDLRHGMLQQVVLAGTPIKHTCRCLTHGDSPEHCVVLCFCSACCCKLVQAGDTRALNDMLRRTSMARHEQEGAAMDEPMPDGDPLSPTYQACGFQPVLACFGWTQAVV